MRAAVRRTGMLSGGAVLSALILFGGSAVPAQAAWTEYWGAKATVKAWKYSGVGSWTGGNAFGAGIPASMIVQVANGGASSQAIGGVVLTHARKTTREECRWTGGGLGTTVQLLQCERRS